MPHSYFIFNETQALELVLGDRDLLNEIITQFYEDGPTLISNMKEALEENNAAGVEMAAHTIKSCLASFGAPEAVAAALQLEIKGRRNQLEGATEMVDMLELMQNELFLELKNFQRAG